VSSAGPAGAILAENLWGLPPPPKVSTDERQKYNRANNSNTACIAEPKQSLHEENTEQYNHDHKQSTHRKTTPAVGFVS